MVDCQNTGTNRANTNEIVIGTDETGNGSNTTTLGNTSTTDTFIHGALTIFDSLRVSGVYNTAGPVVVGPLSWAYPRFRIGGENAANEAYLSNIMNSGYYFRIRGHPSGQGQMHFNANGSITCNTSFTTASDDRLKHYETDILNGLEIIRKLNHKLM